MNKEDSKELLMIILTFLSLGLAILTSLI